MIRSHTAVTIKQKQILSKIAKFHQIEGYYPSIRELNQLLNLKSSNTIFSHLKALVKKGLLQKNAKGKIIGLHQPSDSNPTLPQSISDIFTQSITIPYFPEAIPAGFQAPAEDTKREMLTIDQYVIKHPNNTFALKVKGNSMEKAGIMPGDLLLVEKNPEAKPGQIIVAHLPSGFTVKRLIEENGQKYLKAESTQKYQIKLEEGTQIWGIVVGIVRKY
jgi:DNA polymerase V